MTLREAATLAFLEGENKMLRDYIKGMVKNLREYSQGAGEFDLDELREWCDAVEEKLKETE